MSMKKGQTSVRSRWYKADNIETGECIVLCGISNIARATGFKNMKEVARLVKNGDVSLGGWVFEQIIDDRDLVNGKISISDND